MSQTISHAVALALKKGDVIYSNLVEFTRKDGTTFPATATVLGPAKDDRYAGFMLRVKHHLNGTVSHISRASEALWRTDPEKERRPVRIHRQRSAPALHIESGEEVEITPTGRVRRTRDIHQELLNNALDQQASLTRVRRTRPSRG